MMNEKPKEHVRCRARATLISSTYYYEPGEEFVCTREAALAFGPSVDLIADVPAPEPAAAAPSRAIDAPAADRMVRKPPRARQPQRGASGRFLAQPGA